MSDIIVVVGTFMDIGAYDDVNDDFDIEVFGPFNDQDAADTWVASVEHLFKPGGRESGRTVREWLITKVDEPFIAMPGKHDEPK